MALLGHANGYPPRYSRVAASLANMLTVGQPHTAATSSINGISIPELISVTFYYVSLSIRGYYNSWVTIYVTYATVLIHFTRLRR